MLARVYIKQETTVQVVPARDEYEEGVGDFVEVGSRNEELRRFHSPSPPFRAVVLLLALEEGCHGGGGGEKVQGVAGGGGVRDRRRITEVGKDGRARKGDRGGRSGGGTEQQQNEVVEEGGQGGPERGKVPAY